ncbi:MAG: 6,7-dimethyl-8-ribityllumazine synthase [Opitutaceae bacterium]
MSLDIPSIQEVDGSGMRFAVIASRYNEALVDSLVRHACATIEAAGADTPTIERVPGAAELPFAAATLANHTNFDAIIVIGVVIAGDTNHHEIIGDSTATALLDLSIAQKVPVINGILVVNNLAQAEARAGEAINRGKEFAQAALEMAQFTKKWKTTNNQ